MADTFSGTPSAIWALTVDPRVILSHAGAGPSHRRSGLAPPCFASSLRRAAAPREHLLDAERGVGVRELGPGPPRVERRRDRAREDQRHDPNGDRQHEARGQREGEGGPVGEEPVDREDELIDDERLDELIETLIVLSNEDEQE